MAAFSVCLQLDCGRFSALDFIYSVPPEIRLLILTHPGAFEGTAKHCGAVVSIQR